MLRIKFLLIAFLALGLTGCFVVTVQHRAVEGGTIMDGPVDSYTESQPLLIKVQETQDRVSPKVYLRLIADSDKALDHMSFSFEQGGNVVMSGTVPPDTDPKHIEITEYKGMPLVLDLSATNIKYPMMVRVEGVEANGYKKVIESMYIWWSKDALQGGYTNE